MKNYLLDSNICIYYIKGEFELDQKIESVGQENCYISEITVAELKFGVENSSHSTHNREVVNDFLARIIHEFSN